MTKIKTSKYTCPKCGKESDFTMYESVNVDLNSKLKEKVLSGDFFSWTCPHCQQKYQIHYDFLYHDMKRDFMIYYAPNGCEDINKTVNDMLTRLKGMRNTTYRSVDSYNRLLEKIRIFEANLNDIVIEFAKVLMKFNKKAKVPIGCDVLFEKYLPNAKDDILVFRPIDSSGPRKELMLLEKQFYDKYQTSIMENEKFMMDLYCDNINEKWVLNRL